MSTNNGSSSVCEAHKSLKLLEERHKVLTLSEETRATLFNHLRKMANADAIEVRDILHVLKGTNKEKSTWKTERMDEKMSTVLKIALCDARVTSSVGDWREKCGTFHRSVGGKF